MYTAEEMCLTGFVRVNKKKARSIYNAGETLYIVPCNCRLKGMGTIIVNHTIDDYKLRTFDSLVNEFEWYNCNAETGYYPSYFVKTAQ